MGVYMKAVGVIVEYNPFHNGHLYHLQQAMKLSNSEVVVAVMSGNFLQRGEPALVSKWSRTKMALKNGIDLVIELPFAYATQKAETFAFGAVSLLNSLGVETLCFGSESGEINDFLQMVDKYEQKEQQINAKLKDYFQQGYSYPKAKSLAYNDVFHQENAFLTQPNNILGFHYVHSIKKLHSPMKAMTIKRNTAQYHDENFASESIASATSIRKALESSDLSVIQNVIPEPTASELENYFEQFQTFSNWEKYFPLLKYKILSLDEQQLRTIYGIKEGIENRLKKYIISSHTFHDFMEKIKTKRYTWTRLQRTLLYILMHVNEDEMRYADELNPPPYIRLLGMNKIGQQYLNKMKHHLDIPLVTKPTDIDHPLLTLDLKATSIYQLIYPTQKQHNRYLDDYRTPPIMLDKKRD